MCCGRLITSKLSLVDANDDVLVLKLVVAVAASFLCGYAVSSWSPPWTEDSLNPPPFSMISTTSTCITLWIPINIATTLDIEGLRLGNMCIGYPSTTSLGLGLCRVKFEEWTPLIGFIVKPFSSFATNLVWRKGISV